MRFGNLAMIPSDVVDSGLGPIRAYLCEVRSIGGLSGSPAFITPHLLEIGAEDSEYFLLGMVHGHWDIPPQFAGDPSVNKGIGIVVPAEEILGMIDA